MPRVSRAETEKNRAAIERASSQLIRERGLGVSVADVMGAAGLTHGGFYGHFRSKDELTAVACTLAFSEAEHRWNKRIATAGSTEEARSAVIRGYLSLRNRAATETCPLASLAADIAREAQGKPVREAFHDGLEKLVDILSSVQAKSTSGERREDALAQLSTMVGALVLARATKGEPISDEVLKGALTRLLPT